MIGRRKKKEEKIVKSCDFGHKEPAKWMLAVMGRQVESSSDFYDICDNCKKKILTAISSLESKKDNGNQEKGNR